MGPLVTKVDLKSAISEMDDERLLALLKKAKEKKT